MHRVSLDRRVFANPVLAEYDSPLAQQAFRRALASEQPDLVHFFHLRYLGAGLLDVVRVARIPHLAHLMDFWFLCAQVTLLKSDGSLCGGPADPRANCFQCAYADLHRHAVAASAVLGSALLPSYDRSLLRHTDGLGDLVLAARAPSTCARASRSCRSRWHRPFSSSACSATMASAPSAARCSVTAWIPSACAACARAARASRSRSAISARSRSTRVCTS
ncbi:MAG: hypothetical protein U1E76_26360 [Planctomycetota bacterium]